MKKIITKKIYVLAIFTFFVLTQGTQFASAQWGNTTVDSGWGNTVVDSGWGNTVVDSGWGNTTVDSGWGNTTVDSGWGNTVVDSGWGNTVVDSGWGNTTVDSGWGNTTASQGYTYTPGYSYTPSYSYTSTGNYSGTNYSTYTYPTYQYSGNNYSTYTTPTTNTIVCSDGIAPVNGSCVRTTTITTTTNTVCSDGASPVNGSCVRTTTIPTVNQTICSDGSLPVNGSCTRVTNIQTIQYQSCWDGSVIPTTSVCASQYRTCANGTSVPINQACYVSSTPIYVAPQVIKFNNVVTSVATEISKTSGRCNGIGLVANNALSTGWFEYGETPSLGRTTATANIGSANTAPFSNVLANLKPSTKYYCRAVMQNQYGLVKGEIVGFTTKATVTTYVRPVVAPVKKPVTTKPTQTSTITCSDGSTVPVKSTSSATLINQGEKLIAVQIEKVDGTLSSNETIHYKITYKNLADTKLSGLLIKLTLPQEVVFAGSSAGNYDVTTRTLTLNQDTIDPYTEGIIMVTANVQKDAPIGKTIVTNVYAMYTVPGTNTQDEVTAYVIGSIMPATVIANQDTGAKHVIGASTGKGFMPNSLIEWLALLAILFIIFILGRSIYASYKEEGHASGHH